MKKENIIKYTIGMPFLILKSIYYLYQYIDLLIKNNMGCYYYLSKFKNLWRPKT